SNAEAPPTPRGPTTSGGFPEATLTANASLAPSYAVWSILILMSGWLASKVLASSWNVFCWLSSSPPPRQQNQVRVTGPGGSVAGAVDGVVLGGAAALAGADPLCDAVTLCEGDVLLPQALTRMANVAIRTPGRDRRACIAPPPLVWSGCVSRWETTWTRELWIGNGGRLPAGRTRDRVRSASSNGRRRARCSSGSGRPGRSSGRTPRGFRGRYKRCPRSGAPASSPSGRGGGPRVLATAPARVTRGRGRSASRTGP